jgi:hypothetical protein
MIAAKYKCHLITPYMLRAVSTSKSRLSVYAFVICMWALTYTGGITPHGFSSIFYDQSRMCGEAPHQQREKTNDSIVQFIGPEVQLAQITSISLKVGGDVKPSTVA